jgi:hypothetical protein
VSFESLPRRFEKREIRDADRRVKYSESEPESSVATTEGKRVLIDEATSDPCTSSMPPLSQKCRMRKLRAK